MSSTLEETLLTAAGIVQRLNTLEQPIDLDVERLGGSTLAEVLAMVPDPDLTPYARKDQENTFTTGPQVFVGGATVRHSGGTAGNDYSLSHDGSQSILRSNNGLFLIAVGPGASDSISLGASALTFGSGFSDLRKDGFNAFTITNPTLRWPTDTPDTRLRRTAASTLMLDDGTGGAATLRVLGQSQSNGYFTGNSGLAISVDGSYAGGVIDTFISGSNAIFGSGGSFGISSSTNAGVGADWKFDRPSSKTARLHDGSGGAATLWSMGPVWTRGNFRLEHESSEEYSVNLERQSEFAASAQLVNALDGGPVPLAVSWIELRDSTSFNAVRVGVPDLTGGGYDWTLPDNYGGTSQFLQSNGDGTTTWADAGVGPTPTLSEVLTAGNTAGGQTITGVSGLKLNAVGSPAGILFEVPYLEGDLSVLWPGDHGLEGYQLTSNGGGTLTWEPPGGSIPNLDQVLAASNNAMGYDIVGVGYFDAGDLSFARNDATVRALLGHGSADSYLEIGQDSTHNLLFGWKYNADPSSAVASLSTWGGNNHLEMQSGGGYTRIGLATPNSGVLPTTYLSVSGPPAVDTAGYAEVFSIVRDQTNAVSYPQVASFKLGRYESGIGPSPRSSLTLALKGTDSSDLVAETDAMRWQADGNVFALARLDAVTFSASDSLGYTGTHTVQVGDSITMLGGIVTNYVPFV